MSNAKKLLLTLVVAGPCWASYAQGLVRFANYSSPAGGPNAPVYQADGVTPLSGSQFTAELLAGASSNGLVSAATTTFLTGTGAGYFYGGTIAIPNLSRGQTAWVEVEVWNTGSGASFSTAQASGLPNSWWQSTTFDVILGGGGVNPFPPADLTGLGTSPVYLNAVPEPSALGLSGVAAAIVLLRRVHSGFR